MLLLVVVVLIWSLSVMSAFACMLPLTRKPVLQHSEEQQLFEERDRLSQSIDLLEQQKLQLQIDAIRNHIVESNQRLLCSVAKQFACELFSLDELVGMGQLPLIRSVELFDVSRGYRFSTYATNALRNFFSRQIQRESRRQNKSHPLSQQRETEAELFDNRQQERYHYVSRLLKQLSTRDKTIIEARFGLGAFHHPHTFRQIATLVGLSKERVRVLAHRSIGRLSEHVSWLDRALI